MSDMHAVGRKHDAPASEGTAASLEDEMVEALDSIGSSGKLDALSFLGEQLHAEQSHYWNRFAALAALHAGLLVVAVETSGWDRALTALVGIGLALVWLAIQQRSREYVDRWKPAFHSYRRRQKLLYPGESIETREARKWPSTKLAMLVPWALLIPWFILAAAGFLVVIRDPEPNTGSMIPMSLHIVARAVLTFSYLLVAVGSVGMVFFASRFPLSSRIQDLEYSSERLWGLNGYQVWKYGWWSIIAGTFGQLVASWLQ